MDDTRILALTKVYLSTRGVSFSEEDVNELRTLLVHVRTQTRAPLDLRIKELESSLDAMRTGMRLLIHKVAEIVREKRASTAVSA